MRRAACCLTVAVVVALGGCPGVEPKPDVSLPPVDSTLGGVEVARIDDVGDVRGLAVDGAFLYVAHDGGLSIYDVQDPASPVAVTTVDTGRVDAVAIADGRAYTIDIGASHTLSVVDVSTPASAEVVDSAHAISLTFGGIAAQPGLLWHAVGSNPPSQLYYDLDELSACDAPDRERGAMDAHLAGDRAFATTHFDDYAGDGFDGNGAFGLSVFAVEARDGACPGVELTDIVFFDTHAKNRSEYERSSNSDLQVDYDVDAQLLYVTGEQRLRVLDVDAQGLATELDTIDIPEVLDVSISPTGGGAAIAGLANGDFQIIDARTPAVLRYAGAVETPGIARVVAAVAGTGYFFVGDSDAGVAVVLVAEGL